MKWWNNKHVPHRPSHFLHSHNIYFFWLLSWGLVYPLDFFLSPMITNYFKSLLPPLPGTGPVSSQPAVIPTERVFFSSYLPVVHIFTTVCELSIDCPSFWQSLVGSQLTQTFMDYQLTALFSVTSKLLEYCWPLLMVEYGLSIYLYWIVWSLSWFPIC